MRKLWRYDKLDSLHHKNVDNLAKLGHGCPKLGKDGSCDVGRDAGRGVDWNVKDVEMCGDPFA